MRRLGLWFVNGVIRFAFWFRYRIKVEGLDKVAAMQKKNPAGILFIPNHVAVLIDPLMTAISLWPKYEARPLIVDYMYKIPVFNTVLKAQSAISVPNVDDPKIQVTREQIDAINEQIVEGLKQGDHFQIYPAGRLKSTAKEIVGGASMVHSIVQKYPCNIVLVRVKGLWGSTFSKAYTGATPDIGATLINGIKYCFRNLLFFTPRRDVIVEFEPVPADFPYHADRRTFNAYLERWYNRPDGLSKQVGEYPGESFIKVSLSRWGQVFPQEQMREKEVKEDAIVSPEVAASVAAKLSEVSGLDAKSIHPHQSLGCDLGMDSIQLIEVIIALQKQYKIKEFPYHDIRTVKELMDRVEISKS